MAAMPPTPMEAPIIIAVMGPVGAGKSTFIAAAGGLAVSAEGDPTATTTGSPTIATSLEACEYCLPKRLAPC